MAYLLASRLKSRDAKPEGAKVRLKSGHASRLHHASVIIKGKMVNGHYGKSSCKNFLHGIFFCFKRIFEISAGDLPDSVKFEGQYKRTAGMDEHIAKPVDRKLLVKVINELVKRNQREK